MGMKVNGRLVRLVVVEICSFPTATHVMFRLGFAGPRIIFKIEIFFLWCLMRTICLLHKQSSSYFVCNMNGLVQSCSKAVNERECLWDVLKWYGDFTRGIFIFEHLLRPALKKSVNYYLKSEVYKRFTVRSVFVWTGSRWRSDDCWVRNY